MGQSLRFSQRCHTDAPFIRPPSSDAGTTLSRVKAQHILVFHSCPITPDFPWISPPIGQPCSCWRRFIREKFLKIFINPWVWAAIKDQPRFFLIKLISMKSVMKIVFKTIVHSTAFNNQRNRSLFSLNVCSKRVVSLVSVCLATFKQHARQL